MKRVIDVLKYGKHSKAVYAENKVVVNNNNHKRLVLYCFIWTFIDLILYILSIFSTKTVLRDGSYIYLIMLFITVAFLVILNFIKNKKIITFLFYAFVLMNLFCYKTLYTDFNIDSTVSLICMIYLVSGFLFVDLPIRYMAITFVFTAVLCIQTLYDSTNNTAILDCANYCIAYIIGISIFYYQFNERFSKLVEVQNTQKERDTDYLTGLSNRIVTEKDITTLLEKDNSKCVMMVVDLDDFKSINDNYGHIMGDKILKKVAEVMRNSFRKEDYVSRVGGDEFVIFLSNIPNKEFAIDKARQLIDGINGIMIDNNKHVSCSVGIAFPKASKSYDQIFKKADSAMYQAKKSGKNNYKVYKNKVR